MKQAAWISMVEDEEADDQLKQNPSHRLQAVFLLLDAHLLRLRANLSDPGGPVHFAVTLPMVCYVQTNTVYLEILLRT